MSTFSQGPQRRLRASTAPVRLNGSGQGGESAATAVESLLSSNAAIAGPSPVETARDRFGKNWMNLAES
jgi:hypothetical protein